jgi:hypothetical protein
VGVAYLIPQRTQALDDAGGAAEDALERVFGVLAWRDLQFHGKYVLQHLGLFELRKIRHYVSLLVRSGLRRPKVNPT